MTESLRPDRRTIVKASAAAAAVPLTTTGATLARTAYAGGSDQLKVGLVGCGGRGTGAAMQAIQADPGAVLWAMGDAFGDRLEGSLGRIRTMVDESADDPEAARDLSGQVDVPAERRFVNPLSYQDVLASGVDVILLATPPHFRPMQLRAAVEAGAHVFCEKPMAVDVPGVRSVLDSARMAKEQGTSLTSGFCWRYSLPLRAAMSEIHAGRIGDVRTVHATYLAGTLWYQERRPDWTDMQYALRNWLYRTWLSGDHIVEQAIHSVDHIQWTMNDAAPIACTAIGGREVRTDPKFGEIFDHFSVTYEYEGGGLGFLSTRQMAGCSGENKFYVRGTAGDADINPWAPPHRLASREEFVTATRDPNMYQVEHDELFASIRSGEPTNDGEFMARSTLVAIMGRMSAYTGQRITWDQLMGSQLDLSLESYDVNATPPPLRIAVPGQTPFV